MTYDSGDPAHVREAIRQAKIDSHRTRNVMSSQSGRAWVWDILSFCGTQRNPFSIDPQVTSFLCGQLNVGQMLLSDIMTKCPDFYVLMQEENEHAARRSSILPDTGASYSASSVADSGDDPASD